MVPEELFCQLSLWMVNFCLQFFNFCFYFILYFHFTDPQSSWIRLQYGSGFTTMPHCAHISCIFLPSQKGLTGAEKYKISTPRIIFKKILFKLPIWWFVPWWACHAPASSVCPPSPCPGGSPSHWRSCNTGTGCQLGKRGQWTRAGDAPWGEFFISHGFLTAGLDVSLYLSSWSWW